jgi:flavin reductase (DIM6/NTAB) family NADH-FMN oxidoreductase RutF
VARQAFTINVPPSEAHIREANYLGIVSGLEVDKF